MHPIKTFLATGAALALTLGLAGPAAAASGPFVVTDPKNDAEFATVAARKAHRGIETLNVRYRTTNQRFKATIQYRNLTARALRAPMADFFVILRSGDGKRTWYISGGVGSFYPHSVEIMDWQPDGIVTTACLGGTFVADTVKEQIRYSIPIACLRRPPAVVRAKTHTEIFGDFVPGGGMSATAPSLARDATRFSKAIPLR